MSLSSTEHRSTTLHRKGFSTLDHEVHRVPVALAGVLMLCLQHPVSAATAAEASSRLPALRPTARIAASDGKAANAAAEVDAEHGEGCRPSSRAGSCDADAQRSRRASCRLPCRTQLSPSARSIPRRLPHAGDAHQARRRRSSRRDVQPAISATSTIGAVTWASWSSTDCARRRARCSVVGDGTPAADSPDSQVGDVIVGVDGSEAAKARRQIGRRLRAALAQDEAGPGIHAPGSHAVTPPQPIVATNSSPAVRRVAAGNRKLSRCATSSRRPISSIRRRSS